MRPLRNGTSPQRHAGLAAAASRREQEETRASDPTAEFAARQARGRGGDAGELPYRRPSLDAAVWRAIPRDPCLHWRAVHAAAGGEVESCRAAGAGAPTATDATALPLLTANAVTNRY